MEKMKRAISAFMALVLVLGMLPGVPMVAGAEELESPAETVAEETTAPVTAPAETEVPETTEAPAEPIPEEAVPETTGIPETIPEETVLEETLPEETVSEETVPAETVEELTASAEAVDGEIVQEKLVEEIIVSASTDRTYVGDRVQLSAAVKPADAEYPEVEFYVVEGDIAYNEEVLAEKGVLIAEEAGTLTIAARAKDAGAHDSSAQEEGGKVEVTFVDYGMAINELDIAKDNWYDADEDGTNETVRVMIGETLKLSVHFLVDGVVELPVVTPSIKWSLAEGDEKYAALTPSADGKEVTVTAKAVTETKYITLYVEDSAAGKDSIQIAVYPIPYKVGIYSGSEAAAENEVTGETIDVRLLASSFEDPEFAYYELELTAQVWPKEAVEPMVWTCSDGFLEVKHPIKEGTEDEEDTTKAIVRVYPNEGSSTITIKSKNYPDIKSKVTISRKWCLEQNDIRFSAETLRLASDGDGLLAGKSAQLMVLDCRDENKLETLDSTVVKWELSQEDQAYATLTKEGKLTARENITSGKVITVLCSVIGNEEEAFLELPVIIRPLATEIRLLPGDLAVDDSPRMASEEIINGKTIAVDTADGRDPFKLGVQVWPMDEECGAKQDVKWTSSNTAIAAIDPDTEEIVWKGKNGTVTITAAATDGSGKKASVKLKFGVQVQGIEIIKDSEDQFLRSGQSWTFDVEFTPAKPTETGLTWSLVGENDKKYATLSSGGKLTAKTVYEEHVVTIRATAKDGSGVCGEAQITIKPKKDGILTLKADGEYVTKTTQTIPVGDSIELEAYILGETNAEYVQWKVSSAKTAEVSAEYGESASITMLKTGTVTVTAITTDGTNKKATVTLKGVRMTETIEWTHTHEQTELACGKSLTLKAKAYDAEEKTPTISKLAWSIAPGGEQYAKVSAGKVTAIAGALSPYDEPVDITVIAAATDGSGVTAECTITIYPIARNVLISLSDDEVSDLNVTGRSYTYVMETPGEDTIQMAASVWSENAMQGVKWTSSNAKIASIDRETGEIICKKAGTVTITATALDGSGKKASVKLTIVLRPTHVYFDKLDYGVIAGGKNLKIKPVLLDGNGNKVTGKKLEWSYEPYPGDTEEDGTAYVTSLSGGTLKTKKVTEPKRVLVTFKTQEKYESWESELFAVVIYIYPATSSLQITYNGKDAGKTIWADLDQGGLTLDGVAKSLTGDEPFQGFTWKSSNAKIAEVDPYTGEVIFHKTGTVTITATAADGTAKKDTVKITIRE